MNELASSKGASTGALVFTLLCAVACDSEVSTGGAGGQGGDGAGGAGAAGGAGGAPDCEPHTSSPDPDFARPRGLFSLRVEPEFAVFEGTVLDGPPLEFHTEAERTGSCRLLTYEPAPCTPDCEPGSFCVDGTCLTPGSATPAGSLTLTDFLSGPVQIMEGDSFYYWSTEPLPSHGDSATLTSMGSPLGDIDLTTCVPPPLVPSGDWDALMAARGAGEDVVLAWSDPLEGARVYLRMTTGVGTHGGISPVEIECEGPDTGSLTLPGAYLDDLFADGWGCGECGVNELLRYVAADSQLGDDVVRFRTGSIAYFYYHPVIGSD